MIELYRGISYIFTKLGSEPSMMALRLENHCSGGRMYVTVITNRKTITKHALNPLLIM